MKKEFSRLPSFTAEQNEAMRKAYTQPELDETTTTAPTSATMDLGERRVYYDGTNYFLYIKVADGVIARAQLTVV